MKRTVSDGGRHRFRRRWRTYLVGFLLKTVPPGVACGYALGALLMISSAVCEAFLGIEASGKSFESISNHYRAGES
jgi:hypothetical protein